MQFIGRPQNKQNNTTSSKFRTPRILSTTSKSFKFFIFVKHQLKFNRNKSSSQFFSDLTFKLQQQTAQIEQTDSLNRTKTRYKLSKPKEITQIKTEPSLLNSFISPDKTKEGLAKFSLIYYPNDSLDARKNFISFNDLLTSNTNWTKEFDAPFSENHMVSQQLYHNVKQKALIEESHKTSLKSSYFSMYGTLSTFEKKLKQSYEKVKIYTNDKDKDMKAMLAVQKLIETSEKEEIEKKESLGEMEIPTKIKKLKSGYDFLDNINLHFKFYWYRMGNTEWKPENREGATLTYLNGKCYLYGGKSSNIYNTIIELDPKKWTWKKIDLKNDPSFQARLGHSAISYKRYLLIYGGEHLYNAHLKIRDCLGDIRLIDLDNQECRVIRTFGDFIENRRNHASCLVFGKFLFIYGGINSNGRYLNDLMNLNLENAKWSICECESNLEHIAFHTMIPIYRNDTRNVNDLYKAFDLDFKTKTNNFNKIKEEGIYVFGGMGNQQVIFNRLKILKMGCYPFKWIEPETKGEPPLPRYLHTMNFYQDLNIIIIYGGRNDMYHEAVFSDVCILNIFNLCWSKVSLYGLGNIKKCSHCASIFGSKLLVFGGYTLEEYACSDLFVLELNQDLVKNYKEKNRFNLMEDLDESPRNGEEIKIEASKFVRTLRNSLMNTFMPIPGEIIHGKGKK